MEDGLTIGVSVLVGVGSPVGKIVDVTRVGLLVEVKEGRKVLGSILGAFDGFCDVGGVLGPIEKGNRLEEEYVGKKLGNEFNIGGKRPI